MSVQCATRTVPKVIQTSLLSAISQKDMVEGLDHILSVKIAKNGVSCGILSVEKDIMLSLAVCVNLNAQTVWLILD